MEDSVDLLLSTSIQIMRTYQNQIKEVDKGIQNLMPTPQILESIPGVGPVFAAGIVAQIDRFADETRIAKYAGLFWKEYQSGRFTAENTSLTRTGNQDLRFYLVEAVNSVRRHVPEYRDYYAKNLQKYLSINTSEPSH